MPSTYKVIFYLATLLLLFPLSSHADIKIYLGAPAYKYKHNYHPYNNYYKPYRYNTRNYNPYSNHSYSYFSNFYGNKHEHDRFNYYRNKYHGYNHYNPYSHHKNKRHYNNAYQQGFKDSYEFKQHKRTNKLGK